MRSAPKWRSTSPTKRPLGLEERNDLPLRPERREHRDPVVVAGLRQAGVALPVVRQPERSPLQPSLNHQQAVEIQERIGQQGLPSEGGQGLVNLLFLRRRREIAALGSLLPSRHLAGQAVEAAEILRAFRVFGAKGGDQVLDRQPERFDLRGGDIAGKEVGDRGVKPPRLGPVKLPARGESLKRVEAQAHHVGESPLAFQPQGVLARGEPALARLLPRRAGGLPGAARPTATLAELGFIEPEVDRSGAGRGVADPDRPGAVDRELDIVLDHDRRLAAEGDHRTGVGVFLGERLRVAPVKRPCRDYERASRTGRRRVLSRLLGSGRVDREQDPQPQETQRAG